MNGEQEALDDGWAPEWAAAARLAGVDEVGRGPLAGPVVAGAVILDPASVPDELADSKALSAPRRESLAALVDARAIAWALGRAEVVEIDRYNVLGASMLAMQRAVAALSVTPSFALIDGNRAPALPCPAATVIGGDARVGAISAASILAKVSRDAEMEAMAQQYPGYGFERHKGYATREHLRTLAALGPCPIHRRSFAPVLAADGGH